MTTRGTCFLCLGFLCSTGTIVRSSRVRIVKVGTRSTTPQSTKVFVGQGLGWSLCQQYCRYFGASDEKWAGQSRNYWLLWPC